MKRKLGATLDRMKVLTSETAIKYMEEDIVSAEKRIKELDNQLTNKRENSVDIELVLQYARYLLKHLSDIMFGPVIQFEELPSLELCSIRCQVMQI